MKKKLIPVPFIILALFLTGLRFFDNGLLNIRSKGTYTEYALGGTTVFPSEERPLFCAGGYARLDIAGGIEEARAGLGDLCAKALWQENIEGIVLLYAYSPNISVFETVKDQKVNVMVAVKDGRAAFGCPLLKGSY